MPPSRTEIPRGRGGRPKIITPDGSATVTYTRMSTLAKALDDKGNLVDWKARTAIAGLVQSPSLVTRTQGELATGSLDDRDTKRALNKIVEEAVERAGGSDKASKGTGLHALTEAIDQGRDLPDGISAEDLARLDAYAKATEGYEVLDQEFFVVVDDVRAAGTPDRLVRCPDGRVRIADLKTGAWDAKFPMAVTAQLAGYARGKYYDPADGSREELHEDLDPGVGLLISMPPTGGCEVIEQDLDIGWAVLRTASKIHALRGISAEDFRAV